MRKLTGVNGDQSTLLQRRAPRIVKTCKRCGEGKPLDDYYGDVNRVDGRESQCKGCREETRRQWRNRNRSQVNEKAREYIRHRRRVRYRPDARTPEGRKRRIEQATLYKQRNAHKSRAHRAVAHALRCGELQRPDACELCERSAAEFTDGDRLEAHHDDYDKLLEVRWLCRRCHSEQHYPLREERAA